MSTRMEVTIDERVSGEEVLGLFGRFGPSHLPLSSSRRSMRVLRPIVQMSALSVLDAAKQLTLSDAVAPQLVGHDHPRYILQTLQKLLEEALRGVRIAPGLNEDVEHNAILIDGTPEMVLHASNSDEDLVHSATRSLAAAGGGASGQRNSRRISCTSVVPSRRRPRRRAQPGAAQRAAS